MSERGFANFTDVTLADQATNSMQADNANMAIQGNVAMKVTQSSGQLWNQCKRPNFEPNSNKSENVYFNEIQIRF